MSFIRFLSSNSPWLGAGAVLTFSSCFGQTFFISLFAGEIRGAFELSHGDWGGIYTLGTLASAVLMLWAGTWADRMRARQLGIIFLAMIALICLAMAINPWAALLPFIIFGLRFTGQGMLGHIAVVAMGRWFSANRGKAVAIAATGFLIGESLMPMIFVSLSAVVGWRMSWGIAALLPLLAIPLMWFLLRQERSPQSESETDETTGMGGAHWTRSMALKHWLFWMVAPAFLCPSIFGTALFFQQVHLTETKGWAHVDFVALIPFYVIVATGMGYATGWLIDRVGTPRVLCVVLLPMALAFLIFSQGETLSSALLGFLTMGLTSGAFGALSGTFWPEFYGTKHLGAIRAVAAALMVFGSAIGPGVTGYLIDFGIIFEDQMIGISVILLISSALAVVAMIKARVLLSPSPQI